MLRKQAIHNSLTVLKLHAINVQRHLANLMQKEKIFKVFAIFSTLLFL